MLEATEVVSLTWTSTDVATVSFEADTGRAEPTSGERAGADETMRPRVDPHVPLGTRAAASAASEDSSATARDVPRDRDERQDRSGPVGERAALDNAPKYNPGMRHDVGARAAVPLYS